MRALSRRLLVWLYGATSLVGFLAAPTQSHLYAVAGYAVVVAGLIALLHWIVTERAMRADRVLAVAFAAAGLPMALTAIFTVLGPAGLGVGLVLLASSAFAASDSMDAYLAAPSGAADPAPAAGARITETPKPPTLATMSTSELTTTWHSCGRNLDGVLLRANILDELERRDPTGVHRWMRDGDAARPADYVGGDGLNA